MLLRLGPATIHPSGYDGNLYFAGPNPWAMLKAILPNAAHHAGTARSV
ncbi:hypothetical protein [Romeriopsis navalis]|nr:hypothetical protein [Romeriopsis navalis]